MKKIACIFLLSISLTSLSAKPIKLSVYWDSFMHYWGHVCADWFGICVALKIDNDSGTDDSEIDVNLNDKKVELKIYYSKDDIRYEKYIKDDKFILPEDLKINAEIVEHSAGEKLRIKVLKGSYNFERTIDKFIITAPFEIISD